MRVRAVPRLSAVFVLVLSLLLPVGSASAHEGHVHVLVFSKTSGFRHASIPDGVAAVQQIGAANGWEVDATEDASVFDAATLAEYDAVVWLNTTGDVLNTSQQAAFEDFIGAGGGYVGVHAAADTEYGWSWYGDLVGAYFDRHPPGKPTATVNVADRAHPSTAHLPAEWSRTDEWYDYQTNPRADVHVLATVDEDSYSGGQMGIDHPIAWCHAFDGGRSWYTGLGDTAASYSEPAYLDHLEGGIAYAAGAAPGDCGATDWSNFDKVPLDTSTSNPMELDVADDGRVFYIERDGELNVWDPATNSTTVAGNLDVYQGQEDGLLGIALDPDFATNDRIYLYWSPDEGNAENVLSRFTMSGNSLDVGSEVRMLVVDTQRDQCCHAGGALEFAPNGDLYLATGDDTNPFASGGYTPIDERDGRSAWDAQRTSGDTDDLRGKVLRITPQDDGSYTIPSGNLFSPGQAGTRPEIYAMGLRNPFRIGIDPQTGHLLVADYGPDAGSADPDRGPEGRVEWNIVDEPGNYGWPYCVGANTPYHDYDFASSTSGPEFDCDGGPTNDSPNNTGLTQLPPAIGADVFYGRSASGTNAPEIDTGGGPMAGPVYRYDPTLDSERKWPAYYDGAAIFGEWTDNDLYEFRVDGATVYEINDLLPTSTFLKPMAFEFGPDGALYMIEWGSGFGGNNADSGVYRIDYVGGSSVAPSAVASADPASGSAPLTVQFSSDGSAPADPANTLTYAWDFGDGSSSTQADPSHTYDADGTYNVQLVVTESNGNTGIANLQVVVGNSAPEVTLTVPPEGGFFDFGDTIPYEISVTDAEDGSTDAGSIDCSAVTLQSSLGHDDHAHPIVQESGCTGAVTSTRDDGHPVSEELFWVLEASYTDDGGGGGAGALTASDLSIYNPKRMQAEFFTATGRTADGVGADADGVQIEPTTDEGGGANIGWISDGDYVTFRPMNLVNIDSVTFRVASNTVGGVIETRVGAPDGPVIATTPAIGDTGGWQAWEDVTVDVADPGGTHELYFVVRNTSTTGYLLNLNWIEFNGTGIAGDPAPDPDPDPALACDAGDLDPFDGTSLDSGTWTIVRETQGGHTVADGALTIPTAPGDLIGSTNDAGDLILRPVPAGEWQATTVVTLEPTQNHQQAGLLLYSDDDDYAKVDLLHAGSRQIEFLVEDAGSAGGAKTGTLPADVGPTVYLRMTADADSITAAWSADGQTWSAIGQPAPRSIFADPSVGVYAFAGTTGAPVIDASFAAFCLEGVGGTGPTGPGVDDDFSGTSLDTDRWDRLVRHEPARAVIGGGALTITTAPGDIYRGRDDGENLILQTMPDGDWTIETRLTEDLSGGYGQAGIMAYLDDDTYVKVDVISDGTKSDVDRVEVRSELDGTVRSPAPSATPPANAAGEWWLRLTRAGDTFTGAYSVDGATWTPLPDVTNSGLGGGSAFGVFAFGVNESSPSTVAFDAFDLVE